jgi:DNA invertase Pin-like site-specific DNA recombinase
MKVAIYIRTSTKEQTPELQLRACEEKAGKEYLLFKDQQSAWQDFKERNEFNKLIQLIKEKKITDVYVWDLDRIYRSRKKLLEFFELCRVYNCKIHSYRQNWLEDMNSMPKPWDEIIYNLMLQIMGWIAEEESSKKSDRVKNAVSKKKNHKGEVITTSVYGKKWGRKRITSQTINKILELRAKGYSIKNISKEVWLYDKHGNKSKNISVGAVHKIVSLNS